jgi:hypothetical protein
MLLTSHQSFLHQLKFSSSFAFTVYPTKKCAHYQMLSQLLPYPASPSLRKDYHLLQELRSSKREVDGLIAYQ